MHEVVVEAALVARRADMAVAAADLLGETALARFKSLDSWVSLSVEEEVELVSGAVTARVWQATRRKASLGMLAAQQAER